MKDIYRVEREKVAERPIDELLNLAETVANSGYRNITRKRYFTVPSGGEFDVFITHSESTGDHGITDKQERVGWFHARKENSGREIVVRKGGTWISYDLADNKLFYKAKLDLEDMEPEALEELTGSRVVTPEVRMAYIWKHLDKVAAEEDAPEELGDMTDMRQVADPDAESLLKLLRTIEQAGDNTDGLAELLAQELFRPIPTGQEAISDSTAEEITTLFDRILEDAPVETFALTTRQLPGSELSALEVCRRKDTTGEDYGLVAYSFLLTGICAGH